MRVGKSAEASRRVDETSMARILMVSKPVAPPWHDSSKNLVRDVAGHLSRHAPVLMTRQDATAALRATPGLERAALRFVYADAGAGAFAPALADQARVLASLLMGPREHIWHFFFAPNPRSSSAARLAASLRRVRTVQTVCSAPRPGVDLERVLFADRVVVVSRHTEARLHAAGIDAARVRRVPPAVAPLKAMGEPARRAAREQLGLRIEAPLVLYPGDLEISRGAERALRMHAALPLPDAQLVLACRAKTPAARDAQAKLEALAVQLGSASRVRFLGETPHIHALLGASDVVVLPSEDLYAKMDLPLVLIEAMLLERPVVVLEATAAAELADEGAARAVSVEPQALGRVALELLTDIQAAAQLGARARAAALARYHPRSVAAQYESIYDELLA
jgi:phosphatidylinositol alpha-1,6-mannosyltransferase